MEESDYRIQEFIRRVKYQPNKDNFNMLGNAYFDEQRYDEALEAYQKALGEDPSDPVILANVGNALYFLDAYEQSAHYLRQAIALDPSDTTAWALLGNALYALEEPQIAQGCFQVAVENDPNNLEAMINLGNIYHDEQDFKKAVTYFEQALEITPEDPISWANLGNSRRYLKDYTGAEDALQKALKLDPEYPFALYSLGRYYYDLGHYEQVKELYDRLQQIIPDDSEPHLLLGDALVGLEDFESALDAYGRAISLDPSDAMGFACRGWTYLQLRRFNEAEQDLKIAVQLDPEDSYSLLNLGYCLALEGKTKPARGILIKATRKFTGEIANFWIDAAEIAIILHDTQLAREFVQTTINSDATALRKVEKNTRISFLLNQEDEMGDGITTASEDLGGLFGRLISLSEINRIEFLTELLQGFARIEQVVGPEIIDLWEQYETLVCKGLAMDAEITGGREQKEVLANNQVVAPLSELTAQLKILGKKRTEWQQQAAGILDDLATRLNECHAIWEGLEDTFEEHIESRWDNLRKYYARFLNGTLSEKNFIEQGLKVVGKSFLKVLAARMPGTTT